MDVQIARRKRLTQLLDLAQAYKGWSRAELARALGRDPTKLVPSSGNPKLDLVVDLAEVLDWSVGDVAESVWQESFDGTDDGDDLDFAAADAATMEAYRGGSYMQMVRLARRSFELARTPDERALACNREAGGWDGLGRATRVLEAVQRGLHESPISTQRRLMLQSNLSNAYYTLWHLFEARATARDLIDWFAERPPRERRDRVTQAFSHYVRGNASRRMISKDPENGARHAAAARVDLARAIELYSAIATEFDSKPAGGIANTCKGALLEVDAALGTVSPGEALNELTEGLTAVIDSSAWPVGDWLESYGWWCIFGCNIAMRHLSERDLQLRMAVFTNKADEIAERLGNWSMRERVLTMEYARRQRLRDWTGLAPSDWAIDVEDVRRIVGTMGRFPMFHDTGWKILHTARVVRDRN